MRHELSVDHARNIIIQEFWVPFDSDDKFSIVEFDKFNHSVSTMTVRRYIQPQLGHGLVVGAVHLDDGASSETFHPRASGDNIHIMVSEAR